MKHLDLFSGIGGFAYAADQVFGDVTHIFCDNDKFCQAVLRKHWPESEIYDDIRSITADTDFVRQFHGQSEKLPAERRHQAQRQPEPGAEPPFLLTGGFPCQPFSQAGLRRGTADERHLWPEMLRVIRITEPEWVIAENVGGILTWNDGLVFEQVCADLEAAGYTVQPFVIPAVAVNAPHRRDRVWFVAHAKGTEPERDRTEQSREQNRSTNESWQRPWAEVAAELCGVDDGLPARMGGLEFTKPQHRKEQLKAYGNAIVPQVAMQIMTAIGGQKGRI